MTDSTCPSVPTAPGRSWCPSEPSRLAACQGAGLRVPSSMNASRANQEVSPLRNSRWRLGVDSTTIPRRLPSPVISRRGLGVAGPLLKTIVYRL